MNTTMSLTSLILCFWFLSFVVWVIVLVVRKWTRKKQSGFVTRSTPQIGVKYDGAYPVEVSPPVGNVKQNVTKNPWESMFVPAIVTGETMSHHADVLASVWPEWKLEKELGKGSYGVVYAAVRTDSALQSRAAIKVVSIPGNPGEISSLRTEGLNDMGIRTYFEGITKDFINEVAVMESFKGMQNVVSVEDYKVVEQQGSLGFDIFIRMELLTPFEEYAKEHIMTRQEVIRLGCDICSALELCARQNIIHRDVKPENIFVNQFGCYKLGDFGIARTLENATCGLSQKGTFNYMAPEVANTTEYDHRVDIYSLGLVLHRLLNDMLPPFVTAENRMNAMARKVAVDRRLRGEEVPPPAHGDEDLNQVIAIACSYRPEDRFDTATAMKQALQQVAKERGTIFSKPALNTTVSVRKNH